MIHLSYGDVRDWLDGRDVAGLPSPPDRYRRGHLSMGKSVDRGLAIQRGRARKQFETNLKALDPKGFTFDDPKDWINLARDFKAAKLKEQAMFSIDRSRLEFWFLDGTPPRGSWIAGEQREQARSLGAKRLSDSEAYDRL